MTFEGTVSPPTEGWPQPLSCAGADGACPPEAGKGPSRIRERVYETGHQPGLFTMRLKARQSVTARTLTLTRLRRGFHLRSRYCGQVGGQALSLTHSKGEEADRPNEA